jgi:hypothetical protein
MATRWPLAAHRRRPVGRYRRFLQALPFRCDDRIDRRHLLGRLPAARTGVRGVPAHLCLHHLHPHRGRHRRAHEVRRRDGCSWPSGSPSPTCRSPTWSGPARLLLFNLGAYDFAGGTVVHINSGVAALIAAIVLGPRTGYLKEPIPPHNLTFVFIGAGLLWFGWFGFNAGSNLEANGLTAQAFLNTITGAGRSGASPGPWLRSSPAAMPRSSALLRVPLPVSSPSPRPPVSPAPSGRSCSAPLPAWSACGPS